MFLKRRKNRTRLRINANKSRKKVNTPERKRYILYTVRFANGVIGTCCTYLSGWRPFNVSVMTTKSSLCFKIDSSKIYMALLTRVFEMLKTGERTTADIERILNVSEFMLCGKRSRDFENGREVRIEELCDDDGFDGYAFEKAYGAAASVMYKD